MEITCKEGYYIFQFNVRQIEKNPLYKTIRYSSKGKITLEELQNNTFPTRLALKPNQYYCIQAFLKPRTRKFGMRPQFGQVIEYFWLNSNNQRQLINLNKIKENLKVL